MGMLLLTLVAAACGGTDSTKTVTDDDTGSEILLDSGDELELRLESNASTGYTWQIPQGSELGFLRLESDEYEDPGSDLVGEPGTQVFTFTATGAGAGILRLEYVRSFDDPVVPQRVVEFTVRVDGEPWPPAGSG